MRDYIREHPDYKQDSHVSEKIMYDLAVSCDQISRGVAGCPELFGTPKTKSENKIQPRCAKVTKEVARVTEHLKEIENEKKLTKKTPDILDEQMNKAIGVGVIGGGGSVQM